MMRIEVVNGPQQPPRTAGRTWTVETLLLAGVGLLAAVLRLFSLDAVPLAPAEAVEAWRVWAFWQPAADLPLFATASPAFFSVTSLLTQVVGFTDIVMRLVPAAAGLVLVGLTWIARAELGRFGTIVAALLLAISPTLVVTSRTAGGQSLALLAVMGTAVCWLRGQRPDGADGRWTAAAAAFLGLGLTSAPLFYGGLAALLLTLFLARRLRILDTVSGAPAGRQPLFFLAGTLFGFGTLFLWHLPGVGLTANLPAAWLAAFDWSAGLSRWLDPLLALVRYEFPVLLPGLAAAFYFTWRGDRLGTLLSIWLLASLSLLVLQPGYLPNVSLVTLPAYLLVGLAAGRLMARVERMGAGYAAGGAQLAGLLLILVGVVAANLGRYARISVFDPGDGAHLLLAGLCLLIALVLWITLLLWDRPVGLLAGLLVVLGVALLVNWNAAWRLATWAGNDTRERWVREAADAELPLLVQTMTQSARELRGETAAVTVFAAVDEPLLRWYLRDFEEVRWGEVVPTGETADFILAAATEEPAFGADYLGSNFGYRREDQEALLPALTGLRWWLFGQSPAKNDTREITLWVRADLLEDS